MAKWSKVLVYVRPRAKGCEFESQSPQENWVKNQCSGKENGPDNQKNIRMARRKKNWLKYSVFLPYFYSLNL